MNISQIEEVLDLVECVAEPTQQERVQLEQMLQQPGFLVLMGLLTSVRNGHFQMLSNIGLATEEERCRASVLQGQIKTVDLIRQTLLSLYPTETQIAPNRSN